MTAQPEHPQAPQTEIRIPHTINGIADALTGARRMEFYRAVGQAEVGPDLQHVIATWWGQAMLDTDPDRNRISTAVQDSTLPTVTMAEGPAAPTRQRRRDAEGVTAKTSGRSNLPRPWPTPWPTRDLRSISSQRSSP